MSQSMCDLNDSSFPAVLTWQMRPVSLKVVQKNEWVLHFMLQQITAIQQKYITSKQTFFWNTSKTLLINCFQSTFYFIKLRNFVKYSHITFHSLSGLNPFLRVLKFSSLMKSQKM